MRRPIKGKPLKFRMFFVLKNIIDRIDFSFVTVHINYPELYVESDEHLAIPNDTKPVWMMCKDLRHRCKWTQVEYDVSIHKHIKWYWLEERIDKQRTVHAYRRNCWYLSLFGQICRNNA